MSPLIEIRELTKRFRARGLARVAGREVLAVDRVSLSLERGVVCGLVGESGSGKTTVARCALRLERPTSGSVLLEGRAVESLRREELGAFRRRVQYVCQDPASSLDPRMRIRGSVAEGLVNRALPRAERRERVESLLDMVGVGAALAGRLPHELSGGQRQRVVLARALAMEPELVVLDEPVSSLDVSVQAQIINLLAELRERLGLTYLFISHDLGLVGYFCEIVAVMFRGRIVEVASTDEILTEPLHPYTRKLFRASPVLRASGGRWAEGEAADDPEGEELYRAELREVRAGHLVAMLP